MEKELVNIFDRSMTIISSVMLTADEQNGNNIKTTTIGDFVNPERQYQYVDKIESIRALCPNLEEKLRNKLVVDAKKKALPAGIISGVAVDGISGTNIIERNGVIPFDIDAKDNPALYDWEAVKAAVSKSPYVAYAGLSVTGLGVWGMIPVSDATKHKEHFDAIARDFENATITIMQDQDTEPTILHGIHLDRSPSNIASKRFMSYDPKPYWNTAAQVYTKTIEPVKLYERKYVTIYQGGFNIKEFFKKHNISYNVREKQGGIQYAVTCPWAHLHSSSSKNDSAVFVYPNGALGFKCMHAHCADKHWHQYREFYEPEAYNNSFDW